MIGPYVTPGAIAGCDLAGEVIFTGPEAEDQGIKVGDRVCGAVSKYSRTANV